MVVNPENNSLVLDVQFSRCSVETIMERMDCVNAARDYGHAISITNTESMYHTLKDNEHSRYIHDATFSCCDGVGIVVAGKLLGENIPRLHGPDLMLKCCEYGVGKRWRHYFYGGREGVPELLSKKLTEKYPGLITAGTCSPPFRILTQEEDEQVVRAINGTEPDILWVGLGLLKQERWIAGHIGRINVPWMIGVGAAFDFHAGIIKRAPPIFQKAGLEWLYRLAFEPRMFVRNVRSLTVLGYVAKEAIKMHFRQGEKND